MCSKVQSAEVIYSDGNRGSNLGILAHVSDAQAIAFSFPHQATALKKHFKKATQYKRQYIYPFEMKATARGTRRKRVREREGGERKREK